MRKPSIVYGSSPYSTFGRGMTEAVDVIRFAVRDVERDAILAPAATDRTCSAMRNWRV